MHSDFKTTLKEHVDIVELITAEGVVLRSAGSGRLSGLCPFHEEKTASFMVYIDQQSFHCYGCGINGDVYTFLEKKRNIDFQEAIKELAAFAGIPIPERKSGSGKNDIKRTTRLKEVIKKASLFYHKILMEPNIGEPAREHLRQRGIPDVFCKRYLIGFAPDPKSYGWDFLLDQFEGEDIQLLEDAGLIVKKGDKIYDRFRNRIIIPVLDSKRDCIAFTARTLDESQAKYINSPESDVFSKGHTLFGFYNHLDHIRASKKLLLIEGGFDTLSLATQGYEFGCAPLGTSLTDDHLKLIKRSVRDVVCYLVFDGDNAGLKSMVRSAPMFLKNNLLGKVVLLPEGMDPEDYLKAYGKDAFDDLLANAVPVVEFIAEKLLLKQDGTLTSNEKMVGDVRSLLEACPSATLRFSMATAISEKLRVPVNILVDEFSPQLEIKKTTEHPLSEVIMVPAIRRIITFLLHYPDQFSSLKDASLHVFCSDPLSRYIYDTFDRHQEGEFDYGKMFQNDKWIPTIRAILTSGRIDRLLISNVTLEQEKAEIIKWLMAQLQLLQRQDLASKVSDSILNNTLPDKSA